jgi:hypothetical protein
LDAPSGTSFVISDRPVVWGFRGAVSVKPNELRHPDVQLLAPLSRSLALFAFHASAAPPDQVRPDQVNGVMAAAARRWVAGADPHSVASALRSVPAPVACARA